MSSNVSKRQRGHEMDDTISMADRILREVPIADDVDCNGAITGDIRRRGKQRQPSPPTPPPIPPLKLSHPIQANTRRLGNEKIVLNVGGKQFITYRSTLERIPDTRLSDLDELDPSYDFQTDDYFFDRNPKFFDSILDFYRSGELHFAHCLCGPSVKRELDYWGINDKHIANCCWRAYKSYEEEEETLDILDRTLNDCPYKDSDRRHFCKLMDGSHTPYCQSRRRLWDFLDAPQSSVFAQAWAIFIFSLILVSIALVCLQTHPFFRVSKQGYNATEVAALNITNPKKLLYMETVQHPALRYIDYSCIIVFSLELCLRFFACPSKLEFFKSMYNIIDLFCVVPMIVISLLDLVDPLWDEKDFFIVLSYLSVTSVLRVFRLFKLAKHYRGLKILKLAVRSSLRELLLLFLLIFMGMLIFSTIIYFAEFDTENAFLHIPIGFWWSIITMTTVGYGDFVPVSSAGYFVGAICAISGMLATGLPIPIIASNFNHYYAYARYRSKLSERRTDKHKNEQLALAESVRTDRNTESCRTTSTTVRSMTCNNKVSPEPEAAVVI